MDVEQEKNEPMKKFPQPLHKTKNNKIVLDEAQEEWLCKYYPVTENERIAKAMGVGIETLRKLRAFYGLAKSKRGLEAIHKRRNRRAAKTNERNGCYDRKRGHLPCEATIAGLQRYWQDMRDGKRKSPIGKLRESDPKRYEELMKRHSASRKELIRKERLRVVYGLERKTNLKVVLTKAYTMSQIHHRSSALKRGYLLDVDCSEGSAGRYTIYYDDQTQRSAKFEENCKLDGFKIVHDDSGENGYGENGQNTTAS